MGKHSHIYDIAALHGPASTNKKRDHSKARCQCCGKKYRSVYNGAKQQGVNMASLVNIHASSSTDFVVTCHYGSDFDTYIYRIVGETNFKQRVGIHVCDACIRAELLKNPPTLIKEDYDVFGRTAASDEVISQLVEAIERNKAEKAAKIVKG